MQINPEYQSPDSQEMHIPKVSIGMPVYNGGECIRKALDSLLTQTFTDFELIISDNASTDETEAICREYMKKDSRIRYVRQVENRGAGANFQFVLDEAQCEYFMWAAHDDIRSPNFLSVNLDFLCRNPDFVASISPVRFEGGEFDEIRMGDSGLTGEVSQRIILCFRGRRFHANGRFYSLMRRDDIKNCCSNEYFLGTDNAIMLRLASKGKFNRSSEGWVVLGTKGMSSGKNSIRMFRRSWLDFFIPLHRLSGITMGLCRDFSVRDKSVLVLQLLKYHLRAFVGQFVLAMKSSSWRRS